MRYLLGIFLSSTLLATTAFAAEPARAKSMDELLRRVEAGWRIDKSQSADREQMFKQAREQQKKMLDDALKLKRKLETQSKVLEEKFQQNEQSIAKEQSNLRDRLGTMGELFGVIRQVAGDTRSQLSESLISAQYPGRLDALKVIGKESTTPSIDDLRSLWLGLMQEMKASGEISRFQAAVVAPTGEEREQTVTRVGPFNAVSNGAYLQWMPEVQKLSELGRQPASRYMSNLNELETVNGQQVRAAVDPSRGSILSLLVQTPSLQERLEYGGLIGYLILSLGGLALIGGLMRMVYLLRVRVLVRAQCKTQTASDDNPLGRVMKVYQDSPGLDTETLELKLDEAILKEQSTIDSFLWAIKVVSVAAPLMGLLGTVTGMIETFQAITLFGTGDPKLMAGGISEALVTTMLGLIVAIPLVLLHSWLRTLARRMIDLLGEQSSGMVARQAEARVGD
ncbi:MAG: MotA/TolQ/ExbB proton channel family protein [Deltaproteobacteria bacterium]|nr:MotA/TolQ/ExbB proton channel family protein [Deltaproteobacteria bacterium]MBT6433317.1 MotA/TolQ/ExbB proton channel family protein [Deltaproteobacteria bacterium]MBT6490222.1 MotA/TolQ/ExbB proton channel family protein [Deltaproteobacteria bacterium]